MNRNLSQLLNGMQGAYLVGGSVRDMLLDLSPTDYDLAVEGDPAAFSEDLSKRISGRVVKLGKPGAPLFRILSSGLTIDVSPVKGSSILEDLLRRDFTINAMAYDPFRDRLIDPCGGRKDLSSGSIRMVSKTAFQEDPIRLVRAYRLAATLNLRIDATAQRAIRKQAGLIRAAAGERIREELMRLLQSPSSAGQIDRMAASGLFFSIFPELSELKRPFQPPASGPGLPPDAWIHLIKGFHALESLLNAPVLKTPDPVDAVSGFIREAIGSFPPALLKIAFLLREIGKPAVRLQEENDRAVRSAAGSAWTAEEICRRLRFSNRERKSVAGVILYRRKPFSLFRAHRNRTLTQRKIVRFFMDCREYTPAVLLHALAEFRAESKPRGEDGFDAFIGILFDRFFGEFRPEKKAAPLLTGDDLIQAFRLGSSPLVGFVLKRIEEARLSHEIFTRDGALALAEKILSEKLDNCPPVQ